MDLVPVHLFPQSIKTMNEEKYIDEMVVPYSVRMLTASVCADNSLTPAEVEKEFNKVSPSGTTMGWKISDDTHFLQGQPNPCPCDQYPKTRTHYLFNC